MENLTHTLLGLALAKAGLERATPLATTTLVIASNLPDVDVLAQLHNGTFSYLEHHRGFTHSFIGLALLAIALTFVLTYGDRRFRMRRDHRLRPMRPMRIFWLAYLGGLGHTFMDFTNAYGARPLLPFSHRWFYGDIVFVADPWIWLILGSAVVWLTATDGARTLFWLVIGVALSLIMALALRNPSGLMPSVPMIARVIWFVGLAGIIIGGLMRFGQQGEKLARFALLTLALYYGGMWMAHQSALRHAANSPPAPGVSRLAAWPTPADPTLWQAVAETDEAIYTRLVRLPNQPGEWRELPVLEPKFDEALRRSPDAQTFLNFSRFHTATVETREGGYTVTVRDLRFDLQMRALLDQDLNVQSTEAHWF